VEPSLFFDPYLIFTGFIEIEWRLGATNVTFAVGTVLQELSELRPISLGDRNRPGRFDAQHPVFVSIESDLIRCATWDEYIIPRFKWQGSENGIDTAATLVDKEHFVMLPVAIEIVHRLGRAGQGDLNIIIKKCNYPARDGITTRRHEPCPQMMVPKHTFVPGFNVDLRTRRYTNYTCRRMGMVQERGTAAKPFGPEQFFMV
jgi:hypothetical protein